MRDTYFAALKPLEIYHGVNRTTRSVGPIPGVLLQLCVNVILVRHWVAILSPFLITCACGRIFITPTTALFVLTSE